MGWLLRLEAVVHTKQKLVLMARNTVRVSLVMFGWERERLEKEAKRRGTSLNGLVRQMIGDLPEGNE
jgi:hypothetical protein